MVFFEPLRDLRITSELVDGQAIEKRLPELPLIF